jgi:H/ACA ribonucleoprotein complex non-core subunit NAF1
VPTVPCQDHVIADDEDEDEQQPRTSVIITTKNEVLNPTISVPEIIEVDTSEHIELLGEIQSIIDSVVIIRGLSPLGTSGTVERVLDADSLLVFEDRKVLGCVSSYTHIRASITHCN